MHSSTNRPQLVKINGADFWAVDFEILMGFTHFDDYRAHRAAIDASVAKHRETIRIAEVNDEIQ